MATLTSITSCRALIRATAYPPGAASKASYTVQVSGMHPLGVEYRGPQGETALPLVIDAQAVPPLVAQHSKPREETCVPRVRRGNPLLGKVRET